LSDESLAIHADKRKLLHMEVSKETQKGLGFYLSFRKSTKITRFCRKAASDFVAKPADYNKTIAGRYCSLRSNLYIINRFITSLRRASG
jgi:hypothetical protein